MADTRKPLKITAAEKDIKYGQVFLCYLVLLRCKIDCHVPLMELNMLWYIQCFPVKYTPKCFIEGQGGTWRRHRQQKRHGLKMVQNKICLRIFCLKDRFSFKTTVQQISERTKIPLSLSMDYCPLSSCSLSPTPTANKMQPRAPMYCSQLCQRRFKKVGFKTRSSRGGREP